MAVRGSPGCFGAHAEEILLQVVDKKSPIPSILSSVSQVQVQVKFRCMPRTPKSRASLLQILVSRSKSRHKPQTAEVSHPRGDSLAKA